MFFKDDGVRATYTYIQNENKICHLHNVVRKYESCTYLKKSDIKTYIFAAIATNSYRNKMFDLLL